MVALASRMPSAAAAAPVRTAELLGRWPTGSDQLFPSTATDAGLVCAGDATLCLIDPTVAQPRWKVAHRLPEGAVFRPRVGNDTVVGGGRQALGAWRLADGKPLWQYRARREIGTPCLDSDMVFFGDGHELVGLSLADGKERWRFAAIVDTKISYAPAVMAETVFVGPGDGRLYALERATGRLRWQVDGREEWQYLRQIHVGGDLLIAGTYNEKLLGIEPDSGRQRWEFNAGNFINSHHVADGAAFLWSPTGWLYALDSASGQVRWRLRTTDYRGSAGNWGAILAELVSRQRQLYVLDLENQLHVVDCVTGKEMHRLAMPEPVRPFLTPLGGERIVLGAENGDLLLVTA